MQERRVLSYTIKENEIPLSAIAWDGSTATSFTGNVFYIPVYKNNKFILDGSIASPTWHSYVEFPFVVDAYKTQNGNYSVSSINRALRYLDFDRTSNPTMSGITINDFETYGSVASYYFLGVARFFGYNSSQMTFSGAPVITISTTKQTSKIYTTGNGYLKSNGNVVHAINITPGYNYNIDATTEVVAANVGYFGDGYIKLKFSSAITVRLSPNSIGADNDTFEASPRGHWTYPIYVDSE